MKGKWQNDLETISIDMLLPLAQANTPLRIRRPSGSKHLDPTQSHTLDEVLPPSVRLALSARGDHWHAPTCMP